MKEKKLNANEPQPLNYQKNPKKQGKDGDQSIL